MNNSLKNKLSNLIVVSKRDTSIYTPLNNNNVSIINWVDKNQVKSFFDNKTNHIELNLNVDLVRIENILLKTKNYDDFYEVLIYLQVHLPKTKKDLLKKDFSQQNKEEAIKYILSYLENIKIKLMQVQRKAKEIEKDKGTWNLYLSRYFLKGVTPHKKQIINAPLVMYSVELINENGKLIISKLNEENELNEKLIVFLQRDIGKQKQTIVDFKITSNVAKIKKELENVIENDILISSRGEMNFISETANEIAENYNDLYIEDRMCLGIFEPSGGKLKEDLEVILNAESHLDIFNKNPITSIEQIANAEIYAEPILQINKLDLYQRYAVRASLTDNTIIQGPPGTGKSEVIANIIANLLFFEKDVMMVSEKIAALDVLKKRLGFLNIFMLIMYDNNKNSFYDSIVNLSVFLGNSWINKKPSLNKDGINQQLWKNIKVLKGFKNSISKYNNFVNFKSFGVSFVEFLEAIEEVGGAEYLYAISESGILEKYEEAAQKLEIDIESLFEQLKNFTYFLDKWEINSKDKFAEFLFNVNDLKKYFENYKFDLDDKVMIESIKANADELFQFLSPKLNYQKMLKDNPFRFYDDVEAYKKIKKQNIGLINESFFIKFNDNLKTIKAFLNVFNIAKSGHKKYIFDSYIKENRIVDKKPGSKMFYQHKLTKNDETVLESLNKINELNLDEYNDFEFVITNQEMFNPLAILYFFNKNIFDKKYFEFIDSKFSMLDFDLYLLFKESQINYEKYRQLTALMKVKNEFDKEYKEFLRDDLIQTKIEEYNGLSWKNYPKLISEICRINILKNLANLSNDDKQFIQKAINVASSKKRPPIFKYIDEYHLALKQLFPIWIARPDQVSLFVPLRRGYFEYGIYDEASQMFLERAYPLLFRSNINIVAGDDKQLKPSSFFISRSDDDDEGDIEIDDLDSQDSLLDRAQSTSWNQLMLQNHYRSDSKELIEFSSKYIYDNKLNYASKNNFSGHSALEIINVNGFFDDGKNKHEAETVIKTLERYIDKYKTILVITFNSQQALYINTMLMKNNLNKKIVDKYLNGQINVINIENVQGDEADLVILSVSYARKNSTSKLKSNFGPVIQKNGMNRLNVAITRAKSKMIVIKSFNASDISDTKNENLEVFKKFIAFLDSYEKTNILNYLSNSTLKQFDNEFKEEFYQILNKYVGKHDFKLISNFPVGNKKIDLVIMDKNCKKVLIGIQLNEWKEHYSDAKLIDDIEIQNFLESRGYKLFRIFEHEWKVNKKNVLEKLFLELKNNIKN